VNETPRYRTLRDYLRVLRAQRLLIVGVTIAFAAAAFVVSSLQTKEYTAEASLSFRDIGSDLNLVGEASIPELAPDQRAAVNADQVTRPSVANRVRESLGTDMTTDEVQDAVTTQVGARTNFVIIQATAEDPEFAARLANAYAEEVQGLDVAEVQTRIDNVIAGLRSNLKDAKGETDQAALLAQQVNQTQIAQLETVRELARPVEVARPAETPTEPSSPRTARNTVLGAIVGLAFALLGAFLRDSLDRRLRKTDEVQAELKLPVIGRIPSDALGEVGFANGSAEDAEGHLEAFRVLRANLEFLQADNPLRTVLVTSGAPEEGKSTVAMALAGAAAVAGKRTLLVECDLRRPCFADRLGLNPDPGLTDYLVGQADPADVLQVVKLISPATLNGDKESKGTTGAEEQANLVCITAGSAAPLPAELLGSERFSNFLSKVSTAYDLVVLDTSPILSVVDALEVVPQVDGLVVCVRLARTTREEARAAREALSHLPGRPTGVVVTGVRPDDESYYGYHYGTYGAEDR
jgi:Mrp family chromosome partitioning ATPase/LPS O-antigen subunit length determinant protein (WzzB/FepE family)